MVSDMSFKRTFWTGAAAAVCAPTAWLCGIGDGAQALALALGGLALMGLARDLPDRDGRRR